MTPPLLQVTGWLSPVCGTLGAQTAAPAADKDSPSFWDQLKSVLNKKQSVKEQESVTDKFDLYYDWIHHDEIKLYDSLSQRGYTDWDRYQNIITHVPDPAKDTAVHNIAPNVRVFGWHPYWMGTAWKSYRFNLLNYLTWFSYNINPSTGQCDNPEVIAAWKNAKEMVDAAHAGNCKVLLTITCHTAEGNLTFLRDPESQETLAKNLIQLLGEQNGDGVDINFELIPNGLEAEMTDFVINLSNRLKAVNKKYVLTLDLPVQDKYGNFQVNKLGGYVDLFVLTGYDYYHVRSQTDGPVAPLNDPQKNRDIRHSVNAYLQKGVHREQLILGLPYYGAVWTRPNESSPFVFNRHITYRALKAKYCKETPTYDKLSWSGIYLVPGENPGEQEKCWFDDTLTLSRKFDYILEEKLAGVGIWALGYDNGYSEMWDLINLKFARDSAIVYKEPYLESRYYNLSQSLMAYRSILAVAGIFIVVFLLAGLVVALFDWRVREVFFQHKTLRLVYAFSGVGILLSVYMFYQYVYGKPLFGSANMFAWFAGLTIGIIATFIFIHLYEKRMKELP